MHQAAPHFHGNQKVLADHYLRLPIPLTLVSSNRGASEAVNSKATQRSRQQQAHALHRYNEVCKPHHGWYLAEDNVKFTAGCEQEACDVVRHQPEEAPVIARAYV